MANLLPDSWLEHDLSDIAQLAPVQWLDWPPLAEFGLELGIKREDLLHPQLGGNKLYKLHGHLRTALATGHEQVLSFGGAWSNHIYALAAAGRALQLRTVGVIRGQRPAALSETLVDAQAMGMQLHFVTRHDYGRKTDPDFLARLDAFGPFYPIPEGGGDLIGARGCRALGFGLAQLRAHQPFDVVCCAVGTGGTLAGLAAGLPASVELVGFSVLKGEGSLTHDVDCQIEQLTERPAPWLLETTYHCGGYARYPRELAEFVSTFETQTGVPLDPVYTAKMLWGILEKARAGHWRPGTRILALHSGGLQGRRGFALSDTDGASVAPSGV